MHSPLPAEHTTIGLPTRPRAPSAPPPDLPDYRFIKVIGHGAFGTVWLAEETLVGTYRAVKVLDGHRQRESAPQLRSLADRELEGLHAFQSHAIEHPHLIRIHQCGTCSIRDPQSDSAAHPPGQPSATRRELPARVVAYYVMEIADQARGAQPCRPHDYEPLTLATLLRQYSRLPPTLPGAGAGAGGDAGVGPTPRSVVHIGLALLDAIEYLHRAGLHHRDIKPSNILFVGGVVKLADLGLAAADAEESVGTPGYLPPEHKPSDLYSLGKVLYEMLTGLPAATFPEWPEDLLEPIAAKHPDSGNSLSPNSAQQANVDALSQLRVLINRLCDPRSAFRLTRPAEIRRRLFANLRGRPRYSIAPRTLAGAAALVALLSFVGGGVTVQWRIDLQDPMKQRLGLPPYNGAALAQVLPRDGYCIRLGRSHQPGQELAINTASTTTPVRFTDVQTAVSETTLSVAGAFQIFNNGNYPRGTIDQPGGHIAQVYCMAGNEKVLLYYGQPGPDPGVRGRFYCSFSMAELEPLTETGTVSVCLAFMLARSRQEAEAELDKPGGVFNKLLIADMGRAVPGECHE